MRAMKIYAVFLVIGCSGPASDPNDKAKKELEKFSGTWRIESRIDDGKEAPAEQLSDIRVVIRGDSYSIKVGDKVMTDNWKWFLNTTKVPTTYDIPIPEGPDKGKTMYGICEAEGDTSRYCDVVGTDPAKRPKEFSAKSGSGHRLFVYKRVKE